MEIGKIYEPQRFEPHWSQWWIDSGIFHAVAKPGPCFSLVIPPPNVTGSLHMGHMLDHTVMDVAVRWHRMRGENTLWLPGMDHAGIGTQMVVERKLAEEGISRKDLGREEFVKRVWQWKEEYGGRIVQQMKRVGESVDWARERFTFDAGLSRAVREAFVRLYEKGLIYRGEYMVNWCPRCQTALSDVEVAHEETQGSMWHIRYPVNGASDHLVVATTRPETMLGDTAVAIHPNDARYLRLHGRTVQLPLMDREIPIVLDTMADPEFGTGVVKITPAHDPNDFEAGRRHNLPKIQVIDPEGRMTSAAGAYAGLDRFAARKRVLADLTKLELIEKIEPHQLNAGTCHRCKTVVEPLISTQWFVKTKPLAGKAIEAVESGRIEFVPGNWTKTYFEWMYHIRDWCISRQLWWGHRIPAWHCADCREITVSRETPTVCAHCGLSRIQQDPDVLDTWFSSGLWPFSTMGWPDETEDLRLFYPTSVLITGSDILFFWVARMIMLGIECTGEVPFRQVHMHGLIRDAERQKMSKTRGNTVDPLEIVERYGTDALRISLLIAAAPGTDIAFIEDRVASARAFANKIWNASRLIFMNMERSGVEPAILERGSSTASLEDLWIFSRINACTEAVRSAFEQHRYHEASEILWHFFWHEFCDWYLEIKKLRLVENSGLTDDWRNLLAAFETSLRLLHPVMPFITEELWQRLAPPSSIAVALYPEPRADWAGAEAELQMTVLQDIVSAVRTLRADRKVDKKLKLAAALFCRPRAHQLAERERKIIEELANIQLEIHPGDPGKLDGAVRSTADFDLQLQIPQETGNGAGSAEAKARIQKEVQQLEKLIANSSRQLDDETFLSRAPEKVVASLRAKLAEYEAQLAKSRAALD